MLLQRWEWKFFYRVFISIPFLSSFRPHLQANKLAFRFLANEADFLKMYVYTCFSFGTIYPFALWTRTEFTKVAKWAKIIEIGTLFVLEYYEEHIWTIDRWWSPVQRNFLVISLDRMPNKGEIVSNMECVYVWMCECVWRKSTMWPVAPGNRITFEQHKGKEKKEGKTRNL